MCTCVHGRCQGHASECAAKEQWRSSRGLFSGSSKRRSYQVGISFVGISVNQIPNLHERGNFSPWECFVGFVWGLWLSLGIAMTRRLFLPQMWSGISFRCGRAFNSDVVGRKKNSQVGNVFCREFLFAVRIFLTDLTRKRSARLKKLPQKKSHLMRLAPSPGLL